MYKRGIIGILVCLFLAGCAASNRTINKEESIAASRMRIADSLMVKSAFRKATTEYLFIIKKYPSTKYYAEAVYKSGVLFSNPLNQMESDSAALYWFRVYVKLPVSDQEKEKANIYIIMLERVKQLREKLQKLREVDVRVNENKEEK